MKNTVAALAIAGSLALSLSASANWYLRGDAGASWAFDSEVGMVSIIDESDIDLGTADVDNTWLGQLGVGYNFNPSWRVDLTVSQTGNRNIQTQCSPCNTSITTELTIDSQVASSRGFLNGYYEFSPLFNKNSETMSHFRPYLTAGIGISENIKTNVQLTAGGIEKVLSVPGDTTYELAWRVGAGIAYEINKLWFLDLSYAYVDMGDARTASLYVDGAEANSSAAFNLRANELTLGFRYMIGA